MKKSFDESTATNVINGYYAARRAINSTLGDLSIEEANRAIAILSSKKPLKRQISVSIPLDIANIRAYIEWASN